MTGTGRAQADVGALPVHLRVTFAAASMVSRDQAGVLGFDSVGLVGDLQLGYALAPWLDVRVAMGGGGFPGQARTGGLMSPLLGAAVGLPGDTVRPWLQLNVGTGFTGGLIRPMLRGEVGVDLRLSSAFTLGPALGYSQVFQSDGPRYTTDARFLWFGLVIGLDPQKSHRVTHREHLATEQHTVSRRNIVTQTQQPTEPEPEPEALPEANPPSPELLTLIENTFPTQRNEWLAPVLFNFDSAELKPQGIAMLHEVARELVRRPKLKLLEIQGYADSRGPSEHNRKLSERRASAVLAWLVSHGIERKRLRVAARGAADFVEPGRDESEHEQNRRVVFRVIEPPAN